MKWNGSLIGGILLALVTLYYWLAVGHAPLHDVPLLFRFTYRLFPWADFFWTIAAGVLLYRGIQQARAE